MLVVAPGASPLWLLTTIQKSPLSSVSAALSHACIQVSEPHLALGSTPELPHFPVSLEYIVTLSERELGTKIHVTNRSDEDTLQFQALFHNYIRAPANVVAISPLTGKTYLDKTEATRKLEHRKDVDVRKFTDSVYVDADQEYEINWPQGKIQIKTEGLKDVVVWNPQETAGKAIKDMEDGGWCVQSVGFHCDSLILIQGKIRMCRTWPR